MIPTLHLICGLPGAGKSTLAAKLEAELSAFRFCPDEWLAKLLGSLNHEQARETVESIQWELAQKLLTVKQDVILEFGFWTQSEREAYRNSATKLGARTKLHYLHVSKDELVRRLEQRNRQIENKDLHVNPELIERWIALFEIPSREELEA